MKIRGESAVIGRVPAELQICLCPFLLAVSVNGPSCGVRRIWFTIAHTIDHLQILGKECNRKSTHAVGRFGIAFLPKDLQAGFCVGTDKLVGGLSRKLVEGH